MAKINWTEEAEEWLKKIYDYIKKFSVVSGLIFVVKYYGEEFKIFR